jgi:hypothetical protein
MRQNFSYPQTGQNRGLRPGTGADWRRNQDPAGQEPTASDQVAGAGDTEGKNLHQEDRRLVFRNPLLGNLRGRQRSIRRYQGQQRSGKAGWFSLTQTFWARFTNFWCPKSRCSTARGCASKIECRRSFPDSSSNKSGTGSPWNESQCNRPSRPSTASSKPTIDQRTEVARKHRHRERNQSRRRLSQ